MKKTGKRKITAVIAIWLIYMLVAGFILFSSTNRASSDRFQQELRDQANVIAGQIPGFLENTLYSQYASTKVQVSRIKALSFALEGMDSIEEAKDLLDDYAQSADIAGLAVFDRDGTPLYASEGFGDTLPDLGADDYFDASVLDDFEVFRRFPERMRQYYFDSDNYSAVPDKTDDSDEGSSGDDEESDESDDDLFYFTANNGNWILIFRSVESKALVEVVESFDWREALQDIKVGDGWKLMAIDETDGTLLSGPDPSQCGLSVEALDLRIGGEDRPASLDDLKDAFSEKDAVVRIESDGKDCFAIRLNVDNVLMLMIAPFGGYKGGLENAVIMRAFFLLLVTGICAIYACFQIKDTESKHLLRFGRFAWNRRLSGRLTACAALMCTAALVCGLFMEAVFTRAETFNENRKKARDAAYLYSVSYELASLNLQKWFDEEYLTRCRIASAILNHIQPEEMTWDYLESLAENLAVKYIYVFDADGGIEATNSPYDRLTVGRNDPFYKLLEGYPETTGVITFSGTPGDTLQRAGVSLRDGNHNCTGLVMIVEDAVEKEEIEENLGLGKVYELLCLADGSRLIVVNGNDKTIAGNAEVMDGRYEAKLDSFDYTGLPISAIDLSEDVLQDDFNGILPFLGEKQSISVHRPGEFFFLISTPRYHLEASNLIYVGLTGVAVLLFMALVMVVSCLTRAEAETSETVIAETKEDKKARAPRMTHNTTPFFKERWQRETTPWREKTSDQQFSVVLKLILFVTFAAIFFNAYAAREKSVWYYILVGEWREGINLHSLTACLIYICLLFMLKALIHKLLYITARSIDARGETICQLLDSAMNYILAVVGIFICLSKLGVNTAALSLTAGVAGVIFSIGCQSIVADIIAGFLMIFEGTVNVGDFLLFNDKPEIILSIGIRTTSLKFFGEVTVVRNNDFKNYVLRDGDKETRAMVPLVIDLGESLERVEGILKEELPAMHEILCGLTDNPVTGPSYIGVTMISDYGVQLSFTAFCKGKDAYAVTLALNRELKLMCERRGILIAHHMYTNQFVDT